MDFRGALGVVHELLYLILHVLWQFHLSHRGVNEVELLIEMRGLLVHGGHQGSHVTEYEGRYDGTSDNDQ